MLNEPQDKSQVAMLISKVVKAEITSMSLLTFHPASQKKFTIDKNGVMYNSKSITQMALCGFPTTPNAPQTRYLRTADSWLVVVDSMLWNVEVLASSREGSVVGLAPIFWQFLCLK